MPGLLRARRRLGPRRAQDARGPRGRRVGRHRPEGVDERRAVLEVVHARRAHRPRRAEAQGPHLLPDGHGAGGRRGRPAAPDHRRAGVQRAVHRRRADPGRQRARRRGQRLEGRADDADERARRPRLLAPGAPAPAARRADRGGRGPRAARRPRGRRQARRPAPAHRDAAPDRLPRADGDREVRHSPGPRARCSSGSGRTPTSSSPSSPPTCSARRRCEAGTPWAYELLRTRGNSIEGGTTEVLKNIVAERVLGLPKAR